MLELGRKVSSTQPPASETPPDPGVGGSNEISTPGDTHVSERGDSTRSSSSATSSTVIRQAGNTLELNERSENVDLPQVCHCVSTMCFDVVLTNW